MKQRRGTFKPARERARQARLAGATPTPELADLEAALRAAEARTNRRWLLRQIGKNKPAARRVVLQVLGSWRIDGPWVEVLLEYALSCQRLADLHADPGSTVAQMHKELSVNARLLRLLDLD